ncbi:DNA topoisomerase [Zopfochytrium polystomum]|nr:DNA topoisomerase [Zopfochytrium polystomum]
MSDDSDFDMLDDNGVDDGNDGSDYEPTARKPAKKTAATSRPKTASSRKVSKKKTPADVFIHTDNQNKDSAKHISDLDNDGANDSDANAKKPSRRRSSSKSSTERSPLRPIYQKKTQLEHILLRPDTYIGSVESQTAPMWVYDGGSTMTYRNITWVPGLYKIFDEILVNAADNKVRDPTMDTIKVWVDQEKGVISVHNNGRGIPIELHAKENMQVPELIFGNLLTSSNYDDSERKVTGGRNGYGAKLCNIFSTEFIVETGDARKGLKYKQIFENNMSKTNPPKITNVARAEDFTRITFKPDFAKFGMTHLDNDIVALIQKRAYDLAGCVPGVKVYLNDTRIKIKSFKEYIDMFSLTEPASADPDVPPPPKLAVVYERVNERWEIAVTGSADGVFHQISFVNSICTSKGGTHVASVVDPLVAGLTEIAKKKDKKATTLKPAAVKSQLSVFVNCLIENPTFDSQTKENMTLKAAKLGSKCTISEEFIKKVAKSGVLENVLALAKFKSDQALKKTDGTRSSRISGISKLDDANNAGTRHGPECTLILTEGDSAKSLAVSGLAVVGRNYYGVFPLRGKLLNVREASSSQVAANAEITALKRKTYTSTKDLRYGHIMIMTDQDHDGSHIKGLIINFLDQFWPSLLKIPGFLLEFITPIVRVTPKNKSSRQQPINFFTIPEYEEWKRQNNDGKGWNFKYYKGLGTSTSADAKAYFSNMELHRKRFKALEDEDRKLLDMAFNKKKADERKEWLRQLEFGTFMDHSVSEIQISDFVNKELILFSQADNLRSIPSAVDGLKPGHRKILFCCFKRNLKSEIKVTQLAGYVSEHSAYHHGEASLFSTVVGMAQNFVGSNNVNLLEPCGQFGTRLQASPQLSVDTKLTNGMIKGGKDAASPRYIFTMLNPLARTIYHPEDDALLQYLNDDGQDIEPKWYIPIIPMILCNGADGIGTGWSTSIPNYNPLDIVQNLLRLMDDEPLVPMMPWYRGFQGTITPSEKKDQFRVCGVINKISDTQVQITELPIKVWTQSYKEMLEGWMTSDEDKKQPAWIKDFKEYHSDSHVDFIITLTEENMKLAEEEGLEKKFKLITLLNTSNLVSFDEEGRVCKYEAPEDLLKDFYRLRLKYYMMRKEAMLARLTHEWTRLDNRVRFILEIIEGKLRVQNRKKVELLQELQDRGYAPMPKTASKGKRAGTTPDAEEEREENDDNDSLTKGKLKPETSGGYDYLLSMPIWSLTMEKVNQLKQEREDKQSEISWLTDQTPKSLWRTDLNAFLAQWEAFERGLGEQEVNDVKRSKSPAKPRGRKAVPPKARKPATKKKANASDDDSDAIMDYDGPNNEPLSKKKGSFGLSLCKCTVNKS